MKASNYIVRIPEPCHEDWNKMTPDLKGKFCNSCSKSVFDFSNKTDIEIRDMLIEYKDQKVCGHFKTSQVNRPLKLSIDFEKLPRNISVTNMFAIVLFIVFGTLLFSCTDQQGKKLDAIEVVKPEEKWMMGDISFVPPAEFIEYHETISGDTSLETDTMATGYYPETYVEGAIEPIEIPQEILNEEVVESVKEEQPLDTYVLGMMIVPYTEMKDTSSVGAEKDTIMSHDRQFITNRDNIEKFNSFEIYPNPGNGEFTIRYDVLKRADVRVDIYDMNGRLLKTVVDISDQYEGNYHIPVSLSELSNGIYLISLIKGDKKLTERLVIER